MRIGVFANQDSWYLRDLQRAAGKHPIIVPLDFESLSLTIASNQAAAPDIQVSADHDGACRTTWQCRAGEHDLMDLDVCLVRTMPPGSLEQVVVRMDLLAALERAGVPVINSPRSMEVAIDKYLTTQRLFEADLPVLDTMVAERAKIAMEAFDRFGRDVVVKPLFGGEGRGIARITDPDLAMRAFRGIERLGEVILLQRFVQHSGHDVRILLIGDDAYAMKRCNSRDWRTNMSRGATAEFHEPSDEELRIAKSAARAVGTTIAGVDLITDELGRRFVLEVNAVPGWKHLSRVLETDIAAEVLSHCTNCVASRGVDQSKVDQSTVDRSGHDRSGHDRSGLERTGLECTGKLAAKDHDVTRAARP